jgi:hypothetical protein
MNFNKFSLVLVVFIMGCINHENELVNKNNKWWRRIYQTNSFNVASNEYYCFDSSGEFKRYFVRHDTIFYDLKLGSDVMTKNAKWTLNKKTLKIMGTAYGIVYFSKDSLALSNGKEMRFFKSFFPDTSLPKANW